MSYANITTVKELSEFFKSKIFKKEYKKIPAKYRRGPTILTLTNNVAIYGKFKYVADTVLKQPELVSDYLKTLDYNWQSHIEKQLANTLFDVPMIKQLTGRTPEMYDSGTSIDISPCDDGSYSLPYYDSTMEHVGDIKVSYDLKLIKVPNTQIRKYEISLTVRHDYPPEDSFISIDVGWDNYFVQPSMYGRKVLTEDEVMEEIYMNLLAKTLAKEWMAKLEKDDENLLESLTQWAKKHFSNISIDIIDGTTETTKLELSSNIVIEHTWEYLTNPKAGAPDEDDYLLQVKRESRNRKGPIYFVGVEDDLEMPMLGKPKEDE